MGWQESIRPQEGSGCPSARDRLGTSLIFSPVSGRSVGHSRPTSAPIPSWKHLVRPTAPSAAPECVPAARVSGLSVPQVRRLARRAADAGDPRVAWYAEHRARLRLRTLRGPTDLARARTANWLRKRGLHWKRIARACGYSERDNGANARKMAAVYRERLANGGTLRSSFPRIRTICRAFSAYVGTHTLLEASRAPYSTWPSGSRFEKLRPNFSVSSVLKRRFPSGGVIMSSPHWR